MPFVQRHFQDFPQNFRQFLPLLNPQWTPAYFRHDALRVSGLNLFSTIQTPTRVLRSLPP
jgi:hypothetical protein